MVINNDTPNGSHLQIPVEGRAAPNLAEALQQAGCDRPVFPCREAPGEPYTDKKTGELKTPQVKQPYTHAGKDDATTDPATIRSWWKRWPGALVGINLEKSGLFALDVDTHEADKDGYKTLSDLLITHAGGQPLPKGPAQRTINGGEHRLFRRPIGVRLPGKLGPGLDIKYRGYICTGELPDGRKYQPIEGCELTQEAPEAPAWMVEMFRDMTRDTASDQAQQRRDLTLYDDKEKWADSLLKRLHSSRCDNYADWINVGMALTSLGSAGLTLWDNWSRNSAKYQAGACADKWDTFKGGGLTLGSLYHWAEEDSPSPRSNGNGHQVEEPEFSPFDPAEYEHVMLPEDITPPSSNGHKPPQKAEKTPPPSHAELADRWLQQADPTAYGLQSWRRYDAGVWPEIEEDVIKQEIAQVVRDAQAEGVKPSANVVGSVMEMARLRVLVGARKWDADPDLLPCKNGVLHIPSMTLRPHAPGNYFTFRVAYDYDPAASAEIWQYFLESTLDEETQLLLQEFAGYCLTTDTKYEIALWLHGPRGSGKSTLIEGWRTMIGDRAGILGLGRIEQSRFALGAIAGKTLLTATEQPAMYIQQSDVLNSLISGEPIQIEKKFKDEMTITPVAKIVWAMNEFPRIPDSGNGLFRRVRVIEFPARPEEQRDERIKEAIKNEGSGILNWALAGLARLRAAGKFTIPEKVREASREFERNNNIPALFVEEMCMTGAELKAQSNPLYQAYRTWCIDNGHKPQSSTSIAEDWKNLGFTKYEANGRNYWRGVGIKSV